MNKNIQKALPGSTRLVRSVPLKTTRFRTVLTSESAFSAASELTGLMESYYPSLWGIQKMSSWLYSHEDDPMGMRY